MLNYPATYNDYLNLCYYDALNYNDVNQIKLLLNRGANINEVFSPGILGKKQNPLILSLRQQTRNLALYLINNNANLKIKDEYGNNALMWAIYQRYYDIAKILIDKGCDIQIVNNESDSPLDYALRRTADYNFIQFLLSKGVKITANTMKYALTNENSFVVIKLLFEKINYNSKYLNELERLVILDKAEELKIYLNEKKDIKKEMIQDAGSHAIAYGYFNILRVLIDFGFDINGLDSRNRTAIQTASQYGQLEILKYLLEQKTKINYFPQGENPLIYAVDGNYTEIVQELLHNGINYKKMNIHDEKEEFDIVAHAISCSNIKMLKLFIDNDIKPHKNFILDNVLRNRDCIEILSFLISIGININHKNIYNEDLLHSASLAYVNFEVFKFIIEQNVSITDFPDTNNNPLNIVILEDRLTDQSKKIQLLIKKNAVIDETTFENAIYSHNSDILKAVFEYAKQKKLTINLNDLLCTAAKQDNEKIVDYLITEGANVNYVNAEHDTPLHIAVKNHKLEVVQVLLKQKADTSIKDITGKIPIDYAKEKKWKLIIDCFK